MNPQTRQITFNWSWKDRIIGGRLEFQGDEISLTKRFDIDKQTKLHVRAAFDIHTRRTLFSVLVRPFGVTGTDTSPMGLAIKQDISVDKHLAVEVAARVTMPEARFSTHTRSAISLGEGDFIVDIDQLNLRFMLQ